MSNKIGRRHCIPIIYTRGTYYEVGFDVGRTFSGLIQNFVNNYSVLNKEYLPAYETPEGRKAYDDTYNCVKENFPHYISELEGTADGAQVPFHKLFLLHMDNIILKGADKNFAKEAMGCSSIALNEKGQEILGHTEDALGETLNHFYFVSAHIISDKPQGRWKVKEEKFTSLCYAGHLPGYTMNYNHHGLVFSINTLCPATLQPGKTPRHFITRALLAAETFEQAQHILRDSGVGAGDGCSINMTFLKQDGDRLFHNCEMAPTDEKNESILSILTASPGEAFYHCNAYLRLSMPQYDKFMLKSSEARLGTLRSLKVPKCKEDVIKMLSNESHPELPVFIDGKLINTIAVGIFDCVQKTWSIYADNPSKTDPLVVLPLILKN